MVYRGVERETYSCTPNCERRITLGDGETFFDTIIMQSNARNGQAAGQHHGAEMNGVRTDALQGPRIIGDRCVNDRHPQISTIATTICQQLFAIAQPVARARVRVQIKFWSRWVSGHARESFKADLIGGPRRVAVRWVRRFVRKEDGSAAVEFALVAMPFLALIFAILETALVFFSGQALETAVADASRLIMTGQAQTQGMSQTTFKDAVCARIFGLFDCQSGVYVDVKTFSVLHQRRRCRRPIDSQGNLQNNFDYQPGGPGDIVVVRLFYQWPI